VNNKVSSTSEDQNLKVEEVIMPCLASAATHQRVQWYMSRGKCWIHEQTEKTGKTCGKKFASVPVHPPWIEDSTAVV